MAKKATLPRDKAHAELDSVYILVSNPSNATWTFHGEKLMVNPELWFQRFIIAGITAFELVAFYGGGSYGNVTLIATLLATVLVITLWQQNKAAWLFGPIAYQGIDYASRYAFCLALYTLGLLVGGYSGAALASVAGIIGLYPLVTLVVLGIQENQYRAVAQCGAYLLPQLAISDMLLFGEKDPRWILAPIIGVALSFLLLHLGVRHTEAKRTH